MSKIADANKKIERKVVGIYKKIEKNVVAGYKKIQDKFTDVFLNATEKLRKKRRKDCVKILKRQKIGEIKRDFIKS